MLLCAVAADFGSASYLSAGSFVLGTTATCGFTRFGCTAIDVVRWGFTGSTIVLGWFL